MPINNFLIRNIFRWCITILGRNKYNLYQTSKDLLPANMKTVALLGCVLAIVLAVSETNAIQCSQKLCDLVCGNSPTEEDCTSQGLDYQADGAVCGCCSACVPYIPVLGACNTPSSHPEFTVGGFKPPTRRCAPGSACLNNKCTIAV